MAEFAKLLLASGGGAVLLFTVQAFVNRRKLGADTDKAEAEAAAIISKTAMELLQPLREQVRNLTGQVGDLTEQLGRVQEKAEDLEQNLDACRASNRAKDEQIYMLRRARASTDREQTQ